MGFRLTEAQQGTAAVTASTMSLLTTSSPNSSAALVYSPRFPRHLAPLTSPRLHDVSIDHVTAFPPRSVFIIGGPKVDPRMSGLSVTNSLFTVGPQPIATTGGGPEKNCSAMPRRSTPEGIFRDCFTTYTFHHNVIIGGGGWPKDNKTPGKPADVGFTNFKDGVGGEYRLSATSKFKHAAADQKDVGADLDAIEKATNGVQ